MNVSYGSGVIGHEVAPESSVAAALVRERLVVLAAPPLTELIPASRAMRSSSGPELTTGADISCSTPQPSSAKWSGRCQTTTEVLRTL
jgi:hypothetical protein